MSVGYKAKLDAMMKEFPFIGRYLGDKTLTELPKISRVDLDVIDNWGYTEEWRWYKRIGYPSPISRNYFLINRGGEEIARVTPCHVGAEPREKLWGIFSRKPKVIETRGETVYEAVKRLSDPDQVNFNVKVETLVLPRRTRITIYKVPAGIPFSAWITRIKEIAENELTREISKIDTVE